MREFEAGPLENSREKSRRKTERHQLCHSLCVIRTKEDGHIVAKRHQVPKLGKGQYIVTDIGQSQFTFMAETEDRKFEKQVNDVCSFCIQECIKCRFEFIP